MLLLLVECVGSVPPSAGVVCTDLVGRSFSFTCCCCLSVWGLYPLPRVSSVPTTRDALSPAALMRGACTPFRDRRLYRPQGAIIQFRNLVAALVRGPCIPFRGCRLYRPRWTLIEFHMLLLLLECVGSVPSSVGVVCTDRVGRSFSFTCCCCLSVWGLYPLPLVSSVPTTRDALSTAALMRGAFTPFCERRLHRLYRTLIQVHNLVAA